MTKETSPTDLQAVIANASPETTVFADGSTFDYENGYRSNGAPVATRDRTDAPKIVKTGVIMTASVWGTVLTTLLITTILALFVAIGVGVVGGIISGFHAIDNKKAVVAGINDSGMGSVVGNTLQNEDGNVFALIENGDGTFKCEVDFATTTTAPEGKRTPTGYVFCAPGGPASFSIPVPYDPTDISYEAPKEDEDAHPTH